MRQLVSITFLVMIGAAINVAVAWSCAAAFGFRDASAQELYADLGGGYQWLVHRWDRVAGTRISSRCWRGVTRGPYNVGPPESLLASWGRTQAPAREAPEIVTQIDEAWGMPIRSLSCYAESRQSTGGTTKANVIQVSAPRDGAKGLYLPIGPIWPGMALNTIFYAALCLIAVSLGRKIRDVFRRIRTSGHRALVPLAAGSRSAM